MWVFGVLKTELGLNYKIMSEIKIDIPGKSLTVKKRRTLIGFRINVIKEKIIVEYVEAQYTGTIGAGSYKELSSGNRKYNGDYATWLASAGGVAMKDTIETQLAKDIPGSKD